MTKTVSRARSEAEAKAYAEAKADDSQTVSMLGIRGRPHYDRPLGKRARGTGIVLYCGPVRPNKKWVTSKPPRAARLPKPKRFK